MNKRDEGKLTILYASMTTKAIGWKISSDKPMLVPVELMVMVPEASTWKVPTPLPSESAVTRKGPVPYGQNVS